MKITVKSARDGGGILVDGKQVGYLEFYRGDSTYVRFANVDDAPYFAYGTTDDVARCRGSRTNGVKFAKEALKAAGGDFKKLAELGRGGVYGNAVIDFFSKDDATKRVIGELASEVAYSRDKIRAQAHELRTLKAAMQIIEGDNAMKAA